MKSAKWYKKKAASSIRAFRLDVDLQIANLDLTRLEAVINEASEKGDGSVLVNLDAYVAGGEVIMGSTVLREAFCSRLKKLGYTTSVGSLDHMLLIGGWSQSESIFKRDISAEIFFGIVIVYLIAMYIWSG